MPSKYLSAYYSVMPATQDLVALIRKHSRLSRPALPDLPGAFAQRLCVQLPRPPRALLFDVYGTLFTSASGDISLSDPRERVSAVASAFACSGEDVPKAQVLHALSHGYREAIDVAHADLRRHGIQWPEIDVRAMWQTALAAVGRALPPDRLAVFALCYELHANPVWPMPESARVLLELRRRELPLGIVSNAQFFTPLLFPALLDRSLEQLGFVPELVSLSYQQQRAKPGTELFNGPLAALTALGIDSSQVAYVGNDMVNDVSAAAQAGCMTLLFAGDKRSLRLRSLDENPAAMPDTVIQTLPDILKVCGL